nr:hypothetical protein [Tanacetum cinerariifolium]
PIPIGRPYNNQPDGVLKLLTTRKNVGSLPTLRLALRHPSDSSLSGSSLRYSSSSYAISDSLDDSSNVIESEQRLQGHRITGGDLEVTTMIEGINTLERDNTSLRGMLDVES